MLKLLKDFALNLLVDANRSRLTFGFVIDLILFKLEHISPMGFISPMNSAVPRVLYLIKHSF
jgi:hypothetical protein